MSKDLIEYKDLNDNEIKLSPEIVRSYLANGTGNITDKEIVMFIKLCQHQQLNPFLREVYLVKYGDKNPATMVTGKETFLKRATRHPRFAGHKAWTEGEAPNMIGKAEVYVDGYQVPIYIEVDYEEYVGRKYDGSVNSMWASKPKTMLRKVALVQALREAFPDQLGGMYDSYEINTIDDEMPIDAINVDETATVKEEPKKVTKQRVSTKKDKEEEYLEKLEKALEEETKANIEEVKKEEENIVDAVLEEIEPEVENTLASPEEKAEFSLDLEPDKLAFVKDMLVNVFEVDFGTSGAAKRFFDSMTHNQYLSIKTAWDNRS